MENKYVKIYADSCRVPMKVRKGHFATNHSHINYYIDMTTMRCRLSEAQEAAAFLAGQFRYNMIVDTIVCLEGMEVIGAFLADELTKSGFMSMNEHKTIYIAKPEYNSNSQMIFRDNILPMVRTKNVILLTSSVTTGLSVNKAMEAIQYYGGVLRGIASVFGLVDEVNGCTVTSIFGKKELPDYESYDYRECPLCKQGKKLDALVNAFGYSDL